MNIYYVYMYLDQENVPFYIGKGKDNRHEVKGHLCQCNKNRLLKNKINKVGSVNVRTYFLHKDISEEEAFHWERYWIKYIGRRDLKGGSLCNLTDGGEGTSGYTHSNESRRKMREAQREKGNPFKGKIHSEVSRKRMSESLKDVPVWNIGVPCTKETSQKISIALTDHKESKETRKKKANAHRGKKKSVEHRQNISKGLKGRTFSEEARQKMSEAAKLRWSKV